MMESVTKITCILCAAIMTIAGLITLISGEYAAIMGLIWGGYMLYDLLKD